MKTDRKNPKLALNSGNPESKSKVVLYKPTIEQERLKSVKQCLIVRCLFENGRQAVIRD